MNIETFALETFYNGVRFRSRLEARWAALFNHYDMLWVYEPDGFATPEGKYVPDFFFPGLHTYVEVKPRPNEIRRKAIEFIAKGSRADFLVLDAPVIQCRSYPLYERHHDGAHWWSDMCWCMSEKYLGANPHDGRQRFYTSTGAGNDTIASVTCSDCGGRETEPFVQIRSMRFENGVATEV